MSKVAVVLRHSPMYPKNVVIAVIGEPDTRVDNLDRYLESEAKTVIHKFKEKFVEFQSDTVEFDIIIADIE